MQECTSLEQVRGHIDDIDRRIVALLAERSFYVGQAAKFKRSAEEVRAPARAEQVIAKVRARAEEHGLSPEIVEQVYRAMIAAFTDAEMRIHVKDSA